MPGLLLAIVLGVIVAAAWIPLLSELEAAPVPASPAYLDASLRWAMALTAQRVDGFVGSEGQAPDRLADVGQHPWDSIRYERTGETQYLLTASGPRGVVTYDSSEPVDEFAGSSRETLARGVTVPKR